MYSRFSRICLGEFFFQLRKSCDIQTLTFHFHFIAIPLVLRFHGNDN